MAMTAWRGEVLDQLDLLVGEQADLLAIDGNSANQLIPLEHWHQHERARPRELYQGELAYGSSSAMLARWTICLVSTRRRT